MTSCARRCSRGADIAVLWSALGEFTVGHGLREQRDDAVPTLARPFKEVADAPLPMIGDLVGRGILLPPQI